MGKTVSYEGYTIQSSSRCLADGGKWQLRVLISFEQHGGVKTREFAADGLYATEQEADIHGITFGQRLIDGKVEGQSVMDMKTEDRRSTPRFIVQFRAAISGPATLEGTGLLLDLSSGGCRMESPLAMEPGVALEVRIYVPDLEWPLMIDEARVQWVSGQVVGLAFFRIRQTEQQRLDQVITDLEATQGRGRGPLSGTPPGPRVC